MVGWHEASLVESIALTSLDLIFRTEIERFLMSANTQVGLNIYQCECWQNVSTTNTQSNYTIPFVVKVEIGMKANLFAFREANLLRETLPLSEVAQFKNFSFVPPNCSIKYVLVST